MCIQYDGFRYKGWQKQKEDVNTIQGRLEKILGAMVNEEVQLIGCGRTDAGVHALNYTANFHTNSNMSVEDMQGYLNSALPEDISLLSIKNASERFHSRYNALSKTYLYRINNTCINDVFNRKYLHSVNERLDVEKMRQCAGIIIGTHDFQSFTTLKSKTKSTVRTVNYIKIGEKDNILEIEVNGDGFLWNMVRIIIGTLIEAGKGNISVEEVEEIMNAKKRAEAGPMVPAKALFLKDVEY